MRIINRKAKFNYQILETIEAGIVLTGAEAKSAKTNKIKLDDSHVRLTENGAELINAHIAPYKYADNRNYQPQRTRQLLLHKQELLSLAKKMEGKSLTLVPTAYYLKNGRIKLEIGLARGKKKWDKREAIKRRDLDREAGREIKSAK